MKVFIVLASILVVVCAQDVIEDFKLNWPKVNETDGYPPLDPRITGGVIAMPHEFPYQIGLCMQHKLQYLGEERRVFSLCGGSLISDTVVLTAAHCLMKSNTGVIFAGSHNLFRETDRQAIKVTALNWLIHPDYDRVFSKNDIALIKLPRAVKLSDKVKVVNLPHRGEKYSDIQGRLAAVSGWGRTGDKNRVSDVLRFANLKILPQSVCRLCVDGSKMKSVCKGDSGGPLVLTERDGNTTVAGLTSFGRKEGCQLGYPTVFTRVSSYLDWIHSETGIAVRD